VLASLYPVLRPLLFGMSAERAHDFIAYFLRSMHRSSWMRALVAGSDLSTPQSVRPSLWGQTFRSPVLLAAGFDKHASMYNAFAPLGFGGVEVGTITAHPQPGNDRPRLFRLKQDRALLNRMGFNNIGAQGAAERLAKVAPRDIVLGINIGKSKITPVENAADDYRTSARLLSEFAGYVVINVSSPNTPGLRSLQAVEQLAVLVDTVRSAQVQARAERPVLVKIAPDLADQDVVAVAEFALRAGLDGLIATNTTVAREGLGLRTSSAELAQLGAGGISGPPLRARAQEVLRLLYEHTQQKIPLVAAGGIETADDAWQAVTAGATLVQLYTGLVFMGPLIARQINAGLAAKMQANQFVSWEQAVGSQARIARTALQDRAPL
jgi:dihydroorotate dehydrogenase